MYLIKVTNIATEHNPNFYPSRVTYLYGKDGFKCIEDTRKTGPYMTITPECEAKRQLASDAYKTRSAAAKAAHEPACIHSDSHWDVNIEWVEV